MSWEWVTDEMFDAKLEELANEMSTSEILDIPGVYDAVRDALNDAVLEALAEDAGRSTDGMKVCTYCGDGKEDGAFGKCQTCGEEACGDCLDEQSNCPDCMGEPDA